MYQWPTAEILRALDAPVPPLDAEEVRRSICEGGYGPRLADLLAGLYAVANGGTFLSGALRVLPLGGEPGERPSLLEWNDPEDWKRFAPPASRRAFFFLSNGFGDLLGVPLDDGHDLARNTTTALWIEQYKQEESTLGWDRIFSKVLADEDFMATFLARLKEYEWAGGALGYPGRDRCFSWIVLPTMGGSEGIENLQQVSTYVHVSFSLQVYREFLDSPGEPDETPADGDG
jgi:hypothetical protein